MTTVLGIDLGTSSVKVLLVREGLVEAQAQVALQISRPRPSWSEQHPEDWVAATRKALGELRSGREATFDQCSAIGLSGQMHGAVLLDADDRPLRPAILWNDARSRQEASNIQRHDPDLAEQAGVACMPGFVAPKLLWLRRHEPGAMDRLRTLLFPKDFLRLWLTGERATDVVDASGGWLFDQKTRTWSKKILALLGLDRSVLPTAMEGPTISGALRESLACELGLPRGIPVVAGAGDAAAGSLGLGMVSDGDAFISLGTSAQIFVSTRDYRPAIEPLIHAFAHGLPDMWFQMAAMLNGASALAWWSSICASDVGSLLDEAEGSLPTNLDPLFLPYLNGERTPHNDPQAHGTFLGLKASDARPAMTRAVLEGVAFCLADAKAALEAAGTRTDSYGLTGGGARSGYWAQMIADVLQAPISLYANAEVGPALGAARLAIAALDGGCSEAFSKPAIAKVLLPRAAGTDRAIARLDRWRRTYKALRGACWEPDAAPVSRLQR